MMLSALVVSACSASTTADTAASTSSVETTVAPTLTTAPPTTTSTTIPVVEGDCAVSSVLKVGVESEEVMCLERHLNDRGWLEESADKIFDEQTRVAVRTFQANQDLSLIHI